MQSEKIKENTRLQTEKVTIAKNIVRPVQQVCQPGHTMNTWTIQKYGEVYKIIYFKTERYNNKNNNSNYDSITEENKNEENNNERLKQSISRTKSLINEIALCNEFKYFCTFTMSDEKRNRYDLKSYIKDYAMFVRNYNRKRNDENKVKYLCIPEQHKNGAWHMHGLLKGITENDMIINKYGYLEWKDYSEKFGYFSCSDIKTKNKCANYITKYITKDVVNNIRESNGHLFYASQGMKRKELIKHGVIKIPDSINYDYENDYVKIKWIEDKKLIEKLVEKDEMFCGDLAAKNFIINNELTILGK